MALINTFQHTIPPPLGLSSNCSLKHHPEGFICQINSGEGKREVNIDVHKVTAPHRGNYSTSSFGCNVYRAAWLVLA